LNFAELARLPANAELRIFILRPGALLTSRLIRTSQVGIDQGDTDLNQLVG